MGTCLKCGNELSLTAKFCGKCGAVVHSQTPENNSQKNSPSLVCGHCGAILTLTAKFCGLCGSSVSHTSAITNTTVNKHELHVRKHKTNRELPVKIRIGIKKTWLISGMLILLALSGFLFWYFLGDKIAGITGGTRPEYTIQPTVEGTTTTEFKEADLKAGTNEKVTLSDNSSVVIPLLNSNAQIKLDRKNNDIAPGIKGVETSGSMLTLSITCDSNIESVKPIITIPKSQAGKINPATINIIRVSDMVTGDGTIIKDHVEFLPVQVDKSGNFVAIDFLFPCTALTPVSNQTSQTGILNRLLSIIMPAAYASGSPGEYFESLKWVGNVKYAISTFQGNLNWAKDPKLIQMIPVQNEHFRRPATKEEREKRTKPIVNVIVLVHGHNEEEKGGDIESATGDIWEFEYKQEVWKKLYKAYQELSNQSDTKDINGKPNDCSVFYEFIYPTYRSIFTPVPKNGIVAHQTLGEELWNALKEEFYQTNPIISKMIKEKTPFNLFLVAHSMGGLVSRAAIRFFDGPINDNFKQLITWGTPHQGSPLVSLSYIISAGFNITINGYTFYPYYDIPKKASAKILLDTPGSQDLRWTSGNSQISKFFNFSMFSTNSITDASGIDYDLKTSSVFFNNNLKEFNEKGSHNDKFTFFYGTTSTIAQIKKTSYFFTNVYRFARSSSLAQGSFLIKALADGSPLGASDGAVPVYSQAGRGLFPLPKTVDMGDVTHEDFYGSAGDETAIRTFEVMKDVSKCDCPTLSDLKSDKGSVQAKLVLPCDPKPGDRIDKITIAVYDQKAKKSINQSSDFSVTNSRGDFSGTYKLEKKYLSRKDLTLKIVCKDGSIMEFPCSDINWNVYNKIEITCGINHGSVRTIYQDLRGSDEIRDVTDEDGSVLMNFANGGYAAGSSLTPIKWDGNRFHVQASYDDRGFHYETAISGEITAVPLAEKPDPDKERPMKDRVGILGKESPHIISGHAMQTRISKQGYKTIESFSFIDIPFTVIYDKEAIFANENGEDYIVGSLVTEIRKESYAPTSTEKIFCSSGKGVIQIYLRIK